MKLNLSNDVETVTKFKPERISRSATFTVNETIEKIFPLFGPIRESEWAAGWEPEILYRSGEEVLVEEHMMFQTKGTAPGERYVWVITQYRPDEYLIEYTVSAHERIWLIRVTCKPSAENTRVWISYTYTGLTAEGHRKNEWALRQMFAHELKDWQEAINYYLKTGKQL